MGVLDIGARRRPVCETTLSPADAAWLALLAVYAALRRIVRSPTLALTLYLPSCAKPASGCMCAYRTPKAVRSPS